MAASAAVIFIIALIVVTLITMRIADFIIDSRIGALDRTLGFLFGAARGILLVVVAMLFFNWLVGRQQPEWVAEQPNPSRCWTRSAPADQHAAGRSGTTRSCQARVRATATVDAGESRTVREEAQCHRHAADEPVRTLQTPESAGASSLYVMQGTTPMTPRGHERRHRAHDFRS